MWNRFLPLIIAGVLAGEAHGQGVYLERRSHSNTPERDAARRAAVQTAQGEVDRAQALVTAANARIRATWKANPDLIAAENALAAKQEVYDKAREPVMAKLKQNPAYAAASTEAAKADQAVQQAQPATQPIEPSARTVDAATAKLEKKSDVRGMEETALAADPAATAAKGELDAAREKIRVLQLQFDAVLLNDAEFKTALDQLNAAKSRLTAATGQQ